MVEANLTEGWRQARRRLLRFPGDVMLMATLALSLAGQVVGGAVGGPIGATIGRALGALAGSAVDNALFGERPQPAAHADVRLQGSSEGAPIPRLYGWSRLSGNIIWATELEELDEESGGRQGRRRERADETAIAASFAVGAVRGRGAPARAHLGRRAAARDGGADAAVLSRHRDAGATA